MSMGRSVLFFGVLVAVGVAYFLGILNQESRSHLLLVVSVRSMGLIQNLDSWLRLAYLDGIYPYLEEILSERTFRNLNSSGLSVKVTNFDGVEVILFDPDHEAQMRPAILFIHGGGWSLFNPRLYSPLTAELARRLKTLIVSIDYRKCPIHPYPAAFDDVLAAVKFFFANTDKFNVDPSRVALMGDSAGGNLAVAVTYHLAEMKRTIPESHSPKVLVPLCPVLQVADMMLPSLRYNENDVVLTKKKLVKFICLYAFGQLQMLELTDCIAAISLNAHLKEDVVTTVRANMDWTQFLKGEGYNPGIKSHFNTKENKFKSRMSRLAMDPRFSPLSALNDSEIQLLPPTYVFGASKDPLRDEARLLVERLSSLGNRAYYKEIDFYHDPFTLFIFGFQKSRQALDELEELFKTNVIL